MTDKKTVLIVDDTPENITLIHDLLKDSYRTKVAASGPKALAIARSEDPPDLILLDVMMPEMDGYEVADRLGTDVSTAGIPVIFITAKTRVEDEEMGFQLGAVDYIPKPISPPILKARVRTQLRLKEASDLLKGQNEILERKVKERTRQLSSVQDVVMVAMGSLAETRDNETGNHIRRTQHYVRLLSLHLKEHPHFRKFLTPDTIEQLHKSSPLHDIGKVGVPDRILLKPGKLTDEEFEEMKKHTIYGRDAIIEAEQKLDTRESFLMIAREIACSHHERWDGTGYPEGLSEGAIPIAARLMAVADVYDALITRRCYKLPFPHEKAVAIIREGRGCHFDPDVVDAFLEMQGRFHAVALRYADPGEILP